MFTSDPEEDKKDLEKKVPSSLHLRLQGHDAESMTEKISNVVTEAKDKIKGAQSSQRERESSDAIHSVMGDKTDEGQRPQDLKLPPSDPLEMAPEALEGKRQTEKRPDLFSDFSVGPVKTAS